MVIHIFKTSNNSFGSGFMFKRIGISNAALSVSLCIASLSRVVDIPMPLVWFFSISTLISSFLQLGFNVSLAFERLQVIRNQMEYHSAEAKRKLQKKTSIVVLVASFIIGFACSLTRFVFNNIYLFFVPLSVSRVAGYIALCVIYIRLYFSLKYQNQAIASKSIEQGVPSTLSSKLAARREKQLEHSRKFFIGITSSFFVLNLPTMLMTFMSIAFPPCHTLQGIYVTISICLSLFNMVFDVLLYTYMHRRSRRL